MEWAKEKARQATEKVAQGAHYVSDSYPVKEATETAETVYEKAADYMPERDRSSSWTASIINTQPFSSFKPDPANVWKGYIIFWALSTGCTLAWWTFVTAADYFNLLYPDGHIMRLFPLFYFFPWAMVYVLFSAFGRQLTSWGRINSGLVVAILVLLSVPIIDAVFIQGSKGTTATYWVTASLLAVAGTGDSIAQGSLLGIASELPEFLTHAYVMGASFSGVLMFIVRVITKAALSSSPTGLRIGTMIHFIVGALFLVGVLSLFAYVHYMPAMSYYDSLGLGSMETVRLLLQDEETVTIEVAASAGIAAVAAGRRSPLQSLQFGPALGEVKLMAVSVVVTSVVSLFLFPGFLTEGLSSKHLKSWYPVLLVGTYLVSDFLGRYLVRHLLLRRQSILFGGAWARLILIVLFVLSIFSRGPTRTPLMFVLTALLGVSNGYLIGCLTIAIPKTSPANHAESAGILMATLMTSGSVIGAALSWILILA